MRFIRCQGSFESVGAMVGEECRADIPELYERIVKHLLENTRLSGIRAVRGIAQYYYAKTIRTCRPAAQYMRGSAQGAGVPLEVIAVTTFFEDILEAFQQPSSKCTTFVVQTTQGPLLGHNEDYSRHYLGKMVLLDVIFDGFPRVVGLTFLGMLPNQAGCLNSKGAAITNNSLHPEARPGLFKQIQHFLASLSGSPEEIIEHLARQPVSLTTHYTVAHGPSGQVVSIEVSNAQTADELISLATVGPEPFCHTNHALYLNLKEPDPAVVSGNHSLARLAKFQALQRERLPRTPGQMLDLLSTNDGVLHRTPAQNPTSVTLATVVIRPQTGEIWIRDADPNAARRDWHFSVRSSTLD